MGATLPQVVAWIGGTVIGVLGSDVVGDVQRLGLDAIFPAFFMALLVDELRGGANDRRGADRGGALARIGPAGPSRRAGDRRLRGSAPRPEEAVLVTTLWVAILGVALASAAIKALGPVLVGAKSCLRARTRSSPF